MGIVHSLKFCSTRFRITSKSEVNVHCLISIVKHNLLLSVKLSYFLPNLSETEPFIERFRSIAHDLRLTINNGETFFFSNPDVFASTLSKLFGLRLLSLEEMFPQYSRYIVKEFSMFIYSITQ